MTKRIDPEVAATRTVGVRLTPAQLAQLDEEVALSNSSAVGAQASQASVARALLVEALQARALACSAKPTPTKALPSSSRVFSAEAQQANEAEALRLEADAKHRQKEKVLARVKAVAIENAVIAAFHAVSVPGADLLDVATVVRTLEAQGHERAAIHAELVRLGSAGVDVIELRPDSGGGNERVEDRAIVPRAPDGTPLLTARWLKRPETTPTQEHDSDALKERFREALRLKKTSINKSAEPAGCSITPLRRWLNEGKTLDPLYRENLAAHLDSVDA